MFNNIIYFIIVLLVFNLEFNDRGQSTSLFYSISMIALLWAFYAFMCRVSFKRLARLYKSGAASGYSTIYNRLLLRLSVTAIFIFCIDILYFDLKYLIEAMPFAGSIYVFQGIIAIAIFIIYLSTMWYFSHSVYNLIFGSDIGKRAFITGHIRFNAPVLFPWLMLAIVTDSIKHIPWKGLNMFLESPSGQILFLALFLTLLMIFIPVVIHYFWECKPLAKSLKAEGIREFLGKLGFKYREIVNWPLLEGKMMTAGIMGIIPRFRYIMITDSLMDILTPSELNAVMAHEAGHAKYRHQLLLSLLFFGYFILVTGLFESDIYSLIIGFLISKTPYQNIPEKYYIIIYTLPLILSLIIYFRFIMGFFMRHFEREADTYAAFTLNDSSPIISSLEKIALLSGRTRDVPSWHHFSIKQRVEYLLKIHENTALINRHKRLVSSAFLVLLAGILLLSSSFFVTPVKKQITYTLLNLILKNKPEQSPGNTEIMISLASVYQEMDKLKEAKEIYVKILLKGRRDAFVLNNLAWLLITAENPDPSDIKRGLELAKEAVKLERSPVFLDTLAEAYWLMGNREMAVQIIEEAIIVDKVNPYYRRQLKKFTDNKITAM